MKKCFFKQMGLTVIVASILFALISCSNVTSKPEPNEQKPVDKQTKENTNGIITGRVVYSNLDEQNYEGIFVSIEKTDGLRTASVNRSIQNRSVIDTSRSAISSTMTSENGFFSFEDLEEGTYTIYASSSYSKEKAVYKNVVVRSGQETNAGVLELTATGSIYGTLRFEDSNKIFYTGNTGFLIFLAGTSYMAITDDYGNYKISDIPAGQSYELIAMKGNIIFYLESNVTVYAKREIAILSYTIPLINERKNKSINWRGSYNYEWQVSDPEYLDAYYNETTGYSFIYDGDKWDVLAARGLDGEDGEDGDKGDPGNDGNGIRWRGSFSDAWEISNPEYLDAYYNFQDGCSYIYDNWGDWRLLARAGATVSSGGEVIQGEKGDKGDPGKDGASIVWLGSYSSSTVIPNPKYLNAYFNTTDGCSYIYDGNGWRLLARAGGSNDPTDPYADLTETVSSVELSNGTWKMILGGPLNSTVHSNEFKVEQNIYNVEFTMGDQLTISKIEKTSYELRGQGGEEEYLVFANRHKYDLLLSEINDEEAIISSTKETLSNNYYSQSQIINFLDVNTQFYIRKANSSRTKFKEFINMDYLLEFEANGGSVLDHMDELTWGVMYLEKK